MTSEIYEKVKIAILHLYNWHFSLYCLGVNTDKLFYKQNMLEYIILVSSKDFSKLIYTNSDNENAVHFRQSVIWGTKGKTEDRSLLLKCSCLVSV